MRKLVAVTAVALLFGCEERQGSERSEERANVSDLQQRSEDSLEQAQEAQEQASAEQQDVVDAREEISDKRAAVESAQQELESAEQRAAREAQEAQQAQQQAASVSQTAQQEAATTQQEAQELQRQQSSQTRQQSAQTDVGVGGSGPTEQQPGSRTATETRPFTGDQANIAGKVESVGQGSLVLLEDSGQRTTLAVHPQTEVIIDGQAASLEQIQEGSQVRASFDPSSDQSTPGRIEIQTMGEGQQPQPQPQPQQQY